MAEYRNPEHPAEVATYNEMQMSGNAHAVIQARDIGSINITVHQPKTSEPTDPLKRMVDEMTPRQHAVLRRMRKYKLPESSSHQAI
jgi:hypothetical protein